jgi:hypothetical protein
MRVSRDYPMKQLVVPRVTVHAHAEGYVKGTEGDISGRGGAAKCVLKYSMGAGVNEIL